MKERPKSSNILHSYREKSSAEQMETVLYECSKTKLIYKEYLTTAGKLQPKLLHYHKVTSLQVKVTLKLR